MSVLKLSSIVFHLSKAITSLSKKRFFYVLAPLVIESRSTLSTTFHQLQEFRLRLIVSGSDIGEPTLVWYPSKRNLTQKPERVDVSHYIQKTLINGNFHYGQKTAMKFTISPDLQKIDQCSDLNGNYTLTIGRDHSSFKHSIDFSAEISCELSTYSLYLKCT